MVNLDFYKNKTVLVTGHTGFKGTWLCKILLIYGAKVIGYSLEPNTNPSLFELSNISNYMVSIIGDIRDYNKLYFIIKKYKPEIIFHLAAQPLVRESYKNPRYTFDVNIMGTVNLLECIRQTDFVKSVLNVTTDKVYLNNDIQHYQFKEEDALDGFDPYSNSKSCSELVTHSYKKSFFDEKGVSISTARAGNVIGGGDFSKDRIIPDSVLATISNKEIIVRNPYSIRPYQHVLEPLFIYLEIAEKQYFDKKFSGYFNVGPDVCDSINTGELVNLFCAYWGENAKWVCKYDNGPHEANFLQLDNSLIKEVFNYRPTWHIKESIKRVVEWTKVFKDDKNNISFEMEKEIKDFYKDANL